MMYKVLMRYVVRMSGIFSIEIESSQYHEDLLMIRPLPINHRPIAINMQCKKIPFIAYCNITNYVFEPPNHKTKVIRTNPKQVLFHEEELKF